jgi:N-acetylmuramoyl-L-alanine amidase
MRGDDVQAMQTVLAKLGFDCGRADGIFGPNTLRALTEFQQNYGIVADGIWTCACVLIASGTKNTVLNNAPSEATPTISLENIAFVIVLSDAISYDLL